MELSFEVKSQIDNFITQCENWLMNEPKLILKLDAKFGAIKEYLVSKDFYDKDSNLTIFHKEDVYALFEKFKNDNPNYNEKYFDKYSDKELWSKWLDIRDENETSTVYIPFHKHNEKFDYDLCEELEKKNEEYYVPENIVIHLHLDYNEGQVFLSVGNEDDY
jgi:hypothetical protein